MRGWLKSVVAGLVVSINAAVGAEAAVVAVREPVTGGMHGLPTDASAAPAGTAAPSDPRAPVTLDTPREPPPPLPPPAPEPAVKPAPPPRAASENDARWGLVGRGGYFGLPNFIANEVFVQHPDVKGSSYGGEIRYYGEGGVRGGSSVGIAVEAATAKADGVWQQDAGSEAVTASGDFSMLTITLTQYWTLFPSWYVHPYAGIGIGAAHVKGFYKDEDERVDADIWIPVLHIPIGLAIELGKTYQLAIEGRFLDGIALGGALQVRF